MEKLSNEELRTLRLLAQHPSGCTEPVILAPMVTLLTSRFANPRNTRLAHGFKLDQIEAFIRERVKGQDRAVRHMIDIVTRAVTGVGGARGGRPRGVAFLAGPTGVGKTELAKTTTELLFGDERAYIRFDMSEFSAEHADQRLIGAPPGYIGYDTGGELTNAVRERPFSVLLFDEIEKAHPRILDKFLQVLDDGVLTSGRGERVYFSESLIIFTSNLGMSAVGEDGQRRVNTSSADTYEEMEAKVRAEIERHFKLEIGRPELLNRIGENIIVFDFIRTALAEEIFATILKRTVVATKRSRLRSVRPRWTRSRRIASATSRTAGEEFAISSKLDL
jgi:ATP-dependent Clp protease ATP-binding subunit ClpA